MKRVDLSTHSGVDKSYQIYNIMGRDIQCESYYARITAGQESSRGVVQE
jgi:hypothetical protein